MFVCRIFVTHNESCSTTNKQEKKRCSLEEASAPGGEREREEGETRKN
jgi:hypothetical protein